jgi:acetylglutamate kinase
MVVKAGGEVAADAEALAGVARDLGNLARDARLCVVHGGGPQATELSRRLGIAPRIVGGRRITDAETLEVMKMVLAGSVNLALVGALCAAGLRAVGLAGPSAGLVRARRRPPVVVTGAGPEPIDLGHVGDVTAVNTSLLEMLAEAGYLPVVASLGGGEAGEVYNINADIVAGAVAEALGAARLFHLTGVPGVLRDPADPATRIPRLTAAEARAAIAEGRIRGGMIPKVEESLKVLGRGVGAIHIVGARTQGALSAEASAPGSVGTVLMP